MHSPAKLNGNIKASPLSDCSDPSLSVGREREFRTFAFVLTVLIKIESCVRQRGSINDDSSWSSGKFPAISDTAIRVIESSGIDARAAIPLLGERNLNSTPHPLWRPTGSNFNVCRPCFPAGHMDTDLKEGGLGRTTSTQRCKGKSPICVRHCSLDQ